MRTWKFSNRHVDISKSPREDFLFSTWGRKNSSEESNETSEEMNCLLYTSPFDQFFDLSSATAIAQTMETFRTAMQEAITQHRAEIDAITAQREPATFDNTIRRFEESGEALEAATAAFYNLLSAYSRCV